VIRQSILHPKGKNENNVDVALISTADDPDVCYIWNYDQKIHDCRDMKNLKERGVFLNKKEYYESHKSISKKIFLN